jgi:SsrA-binding protein
MTFAENKKARFSYETLETFDGGIVLTGQETKAIREGGANLLGSYLGIDHGELFLKHASIRPYSKAGKLKDYQPDQDRKILVHTKELLYLLGKIQQKGLTLVPFSLYPHARQIKLSFGLCRGKTAHDKRESLRKRDIERDMRFDT